MTPRNEKELRPRLLIFVIAYFAETTLTSVLERIPEAVFEDYDCEILVVDDASSDRTFEVGHDYKERHPQIRMTVLRNEYNQGYGGNQKVGYAYGLANEFDFVAMVHGDGQYAPEALPALLEPLRKGEADAVFGSRMSTLLGALRGGMPFYKYLGNRILTAAQNLMLRSHLSEFHSGYRIYSLAALGRLNFRLNTNDFHFDTEIIIQLMNARMRIVEKPIPTYYGGEICRVNGMRYAWNVLIATLRNVLHRAGLLNQRRYDPVPDGNTHYGLKLGYASSHTWALECVPDGASVIDIGGGPGGLARELVGKGCRVAVVDQYAPPAPDPAVLVMVADLDGPCVFDVEPYDHLLLLDVVEHLKSPEAFIEKLRRLFGHEPKKVIFSVPNAVFFIPRLMTLVGQVNYGREGILDRTHTRLFTFRSFRRLLRDGGFRITRMRGVPAPFPKAVGEGWLGRALVALNLVFIRLSRGLFAYQIFVEAETTPGVDFVLRDTLAKSEDRAGRMKLDDSPVGPSAAEDRHGPLRTR